MNPPLKGIEYVLTSYRRIMTTLVIAAGLVLAWNLRFIQDDAFISFNFARSLVEGNGLTWFGNRVEGYTNFLWVMWIALGMKLGIEPVAWSHAGGLVCFGGCILVLWETSRLLFKETTPALLAVLLFVGNFSVLSYATGGLETMAQTLVLALAFLLMMKTMSDAGTPTLVALSVTLAASLLTRLDSAVIGGVILALTLRGLWSTRAPFRSYFSLLAPAAIILLTWFGWRMTYYGRVLPNTYYAKVSWDANSFSNGILYLWRFIHWYLIWPFVVLAIAGMLRARKKPDPVIAPVILIVVAWSAYVIAVGGDFMEFRFIIPMSPFLFLTLAYLVYYHMPALLFRKRIAAAALAVVVLTAASAYHGSTFRGLTEDKTLDSIEALSTFYGVYPDHDWKRIGLEMRKELAGTGATISTSAVGSIPFYSGLKTVDAIGLCDTNVNNPKDFAPATHFRPGHGQRVTISYLKRQGVNFVLDQPAPVIRGVLNKPAVAGILAGWMLHAAVRDIDPDSIEAAVAMPLTGQTSLLMLYLTRTPALDSLIRAQRWDIAEVRMR